MCRAQRCCSRLTLGLDEPRPDRHGISARPVSPVGTSVDGIVFPPLSRLVFPGFGQVRQGVSRSPDGITRFRRSGLRVVSFNAFRKLAATSALYPRLCSDSLSPAGVPRVDPVALVPRDAKTFDAHAMRKLSDGLEYEPNTLATELLHRDWQSICPHERRSGTADTPDNALPALRLSPPGERERGKGPSPCRP